MSLKKYINEDLIWIDAPFKSTNHLFADIAQKAFELGFVRDNFLQKITEREKEFPTGLKYENHAIAIPHTDPCTIKKQFVAIVIPKDKLCFNLMDDCDMSSAVDAVFVLGLDNSESQLSVLQEIVSFVQDSERLDHLIANKTTAQILNVF